jgi:hypothetical protein
MGFSRLNYRPQIPSDTWAHVCACKAFPRRVPIFTLTSRLSLPTLRNMQDYKPSTTVVRYSYTTFLTYLP